MLPETAPLALNHYLMVIAESNPAARNSALCSSCPSSVFSVSSVVAMS